MNIRAIKHFTLHIAAILIVGIPFFLSDPYWLLPGAGDISWLLGYYPRNIHALLQVVLGVVCLCIALDAFTTNRKGWAIVIATVAVTFNPIFPIKLDYETWAFLNVVVAAVFAVSFFVIEPGREYLRNIITRFKNRPQKMKREEDKLEPYVRSYDDYHDPDLHK